MGATENITRRLQSFFNRDSSTAPLFNAEMQTYGEELDLQAAHLSDAKAQLSMATAGGRWLDLWGSIFGIYRIQGESDPTYMQRAVQEVMAHRVNNIAISEIIRRSTGYRADIVDLGVTNSITTPLGGGPDDYKKFAVLVYITTQTAMPSSDKAAIKAAVMRSKASGSVPVFFVTNNLLFTSTADSQATLTNNSQYVTGPAATQWTLTSF